MKFVLTLRNGARLEFDGLRGMHFNADGTVTVRGFKEGLNQTEDIFEPETLDRFDALDEDDFDDDPPRPRRLTRQEQLEALADSGCDTWEEYRGER